MKTTSSKIINSIDHFEKSETTKKTFDPFIFGFRNFSSIGKLDAFSVVLVILKSAAKQHRKKIFSNFSPYL